MPLPHPPLLPPNRLQTQPVSPPRCPSLRLARRAVGSLDSAVGELGLDLEIEDRSLREVKRELRRRRGDDVSELSGITTGFSLVPSAALVEQIRQLRCYRWTCHFPVMILTLHWSQRSGGNADKCYAASAMLQCSRNGTSGCRAKRSLPYPVLLHPCKLNTPPFRRNPSSDDPSSSWAEIGWLMRMLAGEPSRPRCVPSTLR